MPHADLDARIRDRAYEIWEAAGRPAGQEHEHWADACRQIERETAFAAAPPAAVAEEIVVLFRPVDEIEAARLRAALYQPEPFSFELFGNECPMVERAIVLVAPDRLAA